VVLRSRVWARTEHHNSAILKLVLPLHDLVGMDIEGLRQLGQRPIALQSRHRHFRLECR
jgi:hypothetical protein